jgi:hypothetical protein
LEIAIAATPNDQRLVRLYRKAVETKTGADSLAIRAKDKLTTDPQLASELALKALALDRENEIALEVLSDTQPASPFLKTLEDQWAAFVADDLEPAQDLILPVLIVLAALLILARLVASYPHKWAMTDERRQRWLWIAGLALASLASGLLTIGIAEWHSRLEPTSWLLAPAAGVVAAVVAVRILAPVMAKRLRLNIEVRNREGEVNEAATGQVIALLAELGAAPPSGVEVPRGADVTVLDGPDIWGTPETKLVAALVRVWKMVFGSTPWRVRIDEENDDVHSVVITRNGHTVASAVIDRDQLGLRCPIAEDPDWTHNGDKADTTSRRLPDLHRFSAAVILTELAQHYVGFEGLLDIKDWRSLGLHYVATTDYAGKANAAARRVALAQAVNWDPRNVPAMLALRYEQAHDRYEDAKILDDYIDWLKRTIEDERLTRDGTFALQLRIRLALISTACNREALRRKPEARVRLEELLPAGDQLMSDLNSDLGKKRSLRADALVEEMQPSAAAAYLSIGGSNHGGTALNWLTDTQHRFSLKGHYNYACLLSHCHPRVKRTETNDGSLPAGHPWDPPMRGDAVKHLRLACCAPDLKEWMAKDPWLAQLRTKPEYRNEFLEGRSDLLWLDPLRQYADSLRDAGFASTRSLATAPDWTLARLLRVDNLVARRLVHLARLAECVSSSTCLSCFQVEITAALLNQGIDCCERLLEARHAKGSLVLARELHDDIYSRCKDSPSHHQLYSWLSGPHVHNP